MIHTKEQKESSSFLVYEVYMKIILKIISIAHLIYYLIMTVYAGIRTTFGKFWLVMSIIWFTLSRFPEYILKYIKWPLRWIALVFFYQEAEFVRAALTKPKQGADYVIVLGAQVKGTRPSKSLLRRIEAAAKYLKANPDAKLIASGGQGPREDITEAWCIYETLVQMGVSSDRILLEEHSVSTWENIQFSAAMVGKQKRFVIVTNGFHLYRAMKTAQMLGLHHVSGLAAGEEPILLLNYYVREFFAWMLYRRRRQ